MTPLLKDERDLARWCRDGTRERPFLISGETYRQIRDWLAPKEMEVANAPAEEQAALIDKYRAEGARLWPWWYPNCHVHVS